jgi:DNA-3-methyladenine glycosylase II
MPAMHSFAMPVRLPFDWEYLLAFLRLRATPGVETVTDLAYTRIIADDTEPRTFSVTFDQSGASLHVTYSGNANARAAIEVRVQHIFKANVDTELIEASLGRDAWLAGFVARQPGLRVPGGWSAFEVAVRAVLGQQVSVPAATTLMGRLVRLAGTRLSETEWLFPTPAQVMGSTLSGMGTPGSRLETLKLLAAFFAESGDHCLEQPGLDQPGLDLPDVKAKLLAIKGIGKWTAGYILMRTSESCDHWPAGDLVLRKALSSTQPLVSFNDMERTFSQWSPYRGYATIHIWRGYVSSKNSTAIG